MNNEQTTEAGRAILLELQQVRDDGRTNMFDFDGVQTVAMRLECYTLVDWLEELRDLWISERSKAYMAALNAMGKLPRNAWQESD